MRIRSTGDVGIGTTNVNYKLEVNGTAGKSGGGSWSNSSDIRLKDVIGNYKKGLAEIEKLRTIKFKYKKDNARDLPTENIEYGFVAQEVQKVFPEAVNKGEDGYLDFNMHTIHIAIVNAVQELSKEKRKLEESIKNQVVSIKTQDERIKKLEEDNEKIRSQYSGISSQNTELKTVLLKNDTLENEVKLLKQALKKIIKNQERIKLTKK